MVTSAFVKGKKVPFWEVNAQIGELELLLYGTRLNRKEICFKSSNERGVKHQ